VISRWGRHREATALQEAAIELAVAGGWTDLELRLRFNYGILVAENDPPRARRNSRELLEIARRIGSTPWFTRAVVMHASQIMDQTGSWDESLELIEEALPRLGDSPPHYLVGVRAILLAARGEPIDQLLKDLDALPPLAHGQSVTEMHRAEIFMSGGDLAAAERHAERALDLDETHELQPWALNVLVGTNLLRGDVAGARKVLERMRARESRGKQSLLELEQLEGGILALEGESDEARSKFARAIEGWRKLERHYQGAVIQLLALQLLPNVPEAQAWAAGAREFFERVGAKAYLKQLDEAMAAIPATPREAAPAQANEAPIGTS
jgi:tetratricopeptide (TPR) repeat protein